MNGRALAVTLLAAILLLTGVAVVAAGAGSTSGASAAPGSGGAAGSNAFLTDDTVVAQQAPPGVRGEPDLNVHLPDPKVNPGETNTVTVQVSNDGDLSYGTAEVREVVTTARNVRVEAEADSPLTVETGQTAIGSVTENQPGETDVAISVPDGVEPGTYDLDVEVRYSYTRQQDGGVTQDRTRTITDTVEVEVDDDARFEITNATTDALVGDRGTLEADVENVGADTARDVDVALESSSTGLGFGDQPRDSARIAELDPGDTATVSYDIAFDSDAPVREYTLDGTVSFKTSDGLRRVDERPSVGVLPMDAQGFSIDDVESDLRVGEDGDVYGTVRNDGPVEARNVVVRYTEESPNVIPIERSVAVGTLEPGEDASFRLPLEIGGEAEAISRTADVAIQYRNADLETRLYEDVELLFDVEPKRDQFLLDVETREIRAGDTVAFDVDVTNNLDQTVTDVEARLFADSPLDSDDDEAYSESLAPGETTTLTFELEAESSGTGKTYPISFDFRYDDERGNSQLSDTTRVPITVVEGEGGFPWLAVVIGLVVVLAAGGGYYLYRRDA